MTDPVRVLPVSMEMATSKHLHKCPMTESVRVLPVSIAMATSKHLNIMSYD